ncbi:HNH endonuclease [Gluconobacter japonicus]|uniref:HNH endonuclease n=1 Tax=Gluconobacter japonicus TaxID=376620 RepID=UPI001B8BA9B3|nr:HNH endonuclease [Gluconobacter japonicus]MBS1050491.1 HNH endonuclease [Gluconobacter japonicus]
MDLLNALIPTWKVKWLNSEAKGSIDFLPAFDHEFTNGKIYAHLTSISGKETLSIFTTHGDASAFVFSYGGQCRAANQEAGVFIGDVMLDYTALPNVSELRWRGEGQKEWTLLPVVIEKIEAQEGDDIERNSKSRVRNKTLANIYKTQAICAERLQCSACGTKGLENYAEAKASCLEVHHKRPLMFGASKNTLNDLTLLCANCHRAIHALNEPYEKFLARFPRDEQHAWPRK